jgi:hypothetical protein
MSQKQFDLSPAGAVLSDAASAEHTAKDKWLRAGKALAKMGLVSEMLVKPTDKYPNNTFNQSVYDQVRGFIIQGISASKKGMIFSTVVPGSISADNPKGTTKWTVADLLGLSRESLRDIDDDVLKTQRREYMQQVDGTYINRIRYYIDRGNGIERKREPKGAKTDDKPAASDDPIVTIQGWIAAATKMVDVADVDRFKDAGLEMIACMRRVRKS